MSGLLVSVRSAAEARAALAGGADLIDVKEPAHGPLGRASDDTIRSVIKAVALRVPVSAALGEWRDWANDPIPEGLAFVKWGLAGTRLDLTDGLSRLSRAAANPVLVAYADSKLADSPDPGLLADWAIRLRFPVFLIDTFAKTGQTLLDWIDLPELRKIRTDLRAAGVKLALAGSLDADAIRRLKEVEPDWFAVRGAACEGGRDGAVSEKRVRGLKGEMDGRD